MNLQPRRTDEPELNLTSLMDVLLILLVFFMVSTTFQQEGRMIVRLPQANEAPATAAQQTPLIVFLGLILAVIAMVYLVATMRSIWAGELGCSSVARAVVPGSSTKRSRISSTSSQRVKNASTQAPVALMVRAVPTDRAARAKWVAWAVRAGSRIGPLLDLALNNQHLAFDLDQAPGDSVR